MNKEYKRIELFGDIRASLIAKERSSRGRVICRFWQHCEAVKNLWHTCAITLRRCSGEWINVSANTRILAVKSSPTETSCRICSNTAKTNVFVQSGFFLTILRREWSICSAYAGDTLSFDNWMRSGTQPNWQFTAHFITCTQAFQDPVTQRHSIHKDHI